MPIADVMRLPQARRKSLVVLPQFGEHVLWLDVLGIVVQHALQASDVAYGPKGRPSHLANPLGDRIGHREELVGLFIQEQVIVAEMRPAHVPVKVLGLQVESENVCRDGIQRSSNVFRRRRV